MVRAGGAGEVAPNREEFRVPSGVLSPGEQRESGPPAPLAGGSGRLLSARRVRVCAGRACDPPGRCQGPHNGAPGVGARPAHSVRNNHCSAAAGPAASRGGRTEGGRAADGPRVSGFQPEEGAGSPGRGRGGIRLLPTPTGPSQPWVSEQGWADCPPPLPPRAGRRGNKSPRSGLG